MAWYVKRKSTFNKKTNRKTLSRQTRRMKPISRRSDGRVYPNSQTRRRKVHDNFKRELREKRRNSSSLGMNENFSRMGGTISPEDYYDDLYTPQCLPPTCLCQHLSPPGCLTSCCGPANEEEVHVAK